VVLCALMMLGCRRIEIRARCTVRSAGSYCTFQNTGRQAGRACFRVQVRGRNGGPLRASARVCSPALQSNDESAPEPIVFGEPETNPFEHCTVDPTTGRAIDCTTVVTTERIESM
jgi:hypothetical protein